MVNRILYGRDIDSWLSKHALLAAESFNSLAAMLIVEAEDQIATLDFASKTYRQTDFVSERLKKMVRAAAEPLADSLLEAANHDLALIVDAEAVRIKVSDYAVQQDGVLDGIGRVLVGIMPFSLTTSLHVRARDYIRSTLVRGTTEVPAVLEQINQAYADAAKRALKL